MTDDKIQNILDIMHISENLVSWECFYDPEDGAPYRVWKLILPKRVLVLKESGKQEIDTYQSFFCESSGYMLPVVASACVEDHWYFLTEFFPGNDLCRCSRDSLTTVLRTLIAMQKKWWNAEPTKSGWHYQQSLDGVEKRLKYLPDQQLCDVYAEFLEVYSSVPRTLCHNDLLPYNVLCNQDKAVFIDWEYGGILPYLTSLARLIAHGQEIENALFYMTESDKNYAISYYFNHFVQNMGIPYQQYIYAVELFVFYEYCEWIYLGNRYQNTQNDRYAYYFRKAKELANKIIGERS